MENNLNNNNEALDALFWKEEILQVLYWMDGEELAEEVPFDRLVILLNTSTEKLLEHILKNELAGLIVRKNVALNKEGTVSLTPIGKKEAGLGARLLMRDGIRPVMASRSARGRSGCCRRA